MAEYNQWGEASDCKLIPDPKTEYRIAFWAQNSDCDAYNTDDLQKVTVDYTYNDKDGQSHNYKNNLENRDAFCCYIDFKGSDTGEHQAILKRPFAQLNVGTAGWDYEGFARLEPHKKLVKYSKIIINGPIYNQFNVLTGEIDKPDDSQVDTEVIFDWAPLPAYIHFGDEFKDLNKNTVKFDSITGVMETNSREEYLKIDKDNDNALASFIGWAKYTNTINDPENKDKDFTANSTSNPLFTEYFKYMSMCYILTDDPCNVTFYCSGAETEEELAEENDEDNKMFELVTVPFDINMRTNLIPKPDKGFFMNANGLHLDIHEEYFAEYWKRSHSTDDSWSDLYGGQSVNGDNQYHDWEHDDEYDETFQNGYVMELPLYEAPDIEVNLEEEFSDEECNYFFFEENEFKNVVLTIPPLSADKSIGTYKYKYKFTDASGNEYRDANGDAIEPVYFKNETDTVFKLTIPYTTLYSGAITSKGVECKLQAVVDPEYPAGTTEVGKKYTNSKVVTCYVPVPDECKLSYSWTFKKEIDPDEDNDELHGSQLWNNINDIKFTESNGYRVNNSSDGQKANIIAYNPHPDSQKNKLQLDNTNSIEFVSSGNDGEDYYLSFDLKKSCILEVEASGGNDGDRYITVRYNDDTDDFITVPQYKTANSIEIAKEKIGKIRLYSKGSNIWVYRITLRNY